MSRDRGPWPGKHLGRKLVVAAVYGVLFLFFDRASLRYAMWHSISAWYPPAGLSVALLLGLGLEYAPVVAFAYVLGGLLDWSWVSFATVLSSMGLALAYIVGVATLKKLRIRSELAGARDVCLFLLIVSASATLSALIGTWAEVSDGVLRPSQRPVAGLHWWLGDSVGVASLAPALLVYVAPRVRNWIEGNRASWEGGREARLDFGPHIGFWPVAEVAGECVSLLLVMWVVFGWRRLEHYQVLYLYFIPLLWIALRHGLPGTTLGLLWLNLLTAAGLTFLSPNPARLQRSQLLMLVLSLTGLVLGAVVSERRRVAEALGVSEGRYRDLVDGADAIVWEAHARTGQFTFVSQRAETLLGYPVTRWLCEPNFVFKMIHADDMEFVVSRHNQAVEAKQDYDVEFRAISRDRRQLWLHTRVRLLLDSEGQPWQLRGLMTDVTERRQAEESLRELSGRLLRLQDEERRRVALELHDGAAQNLGALLMNLERVRDCAAAGGGSQLGDLIDDSVAMAQESLRGVRTLSYLLYPPLLEEAGLAAALRQFVDGFSERSGIGVDVQIDQKLGRLSRDVETALFRVAQECLTNIHRHSGSHSARLRLERTPNEIRLEISDRGDGLRREPDEADDEAVTRLGVGIPGMRERMRQLGGRLDIHSGGEGTAVTAVVPWSRGGLS